MLSYFCLLDYRLYLSIMLFLSIFSRFVDIVGGTYLHPIVAIFSERILAHTPIHQFFVDVYVVETASLWSDMLLD